MTNRERIEAYFDDQLSTTEKESLLRDIEADQSLKTEFEFQKEVIEGIQAYRKQELISRLNNVEVASVGTSTLTKIIGIIGAVAILSGGTLWYFNKDEVTTPSVIPTELSKELQSEQTNTEAVVPKEEAETPVVTDQPDLADEKEQDTRVTETMAEPITETTITEVKVPEMVEPDSEGIAAVTDDREAPESMNSEAVTVTSSADVEIKLDKKYNFHYQVLNGDLTLYGAFNESKFEVIELNTTVGLKLYLYFNERYFELKNDSEKIRPLEAVENKEIIEELDKRRL